MSTNTENTEELPIETSSVHLQLFEDFLRKLEVNPNEATINRPLYEISADILAFDELMRATGGDISHPEVEKAFQYIFNKNDEDLKRKVQSYCYLIKAKEERGASKVENGKRIQALGTTELNEAKAMRVQLIFNLENLGISKMELDDFKISIALNGGVLPIVINEKIELSRNAQRTYTKVEKKTVWDTDSIREALNSGKKLTFAQFAERSKKILGIK